MPEPSLIESYLAAMRRLLRVSPAEADRIIEEAEDHLTLAVLEGTEAGLSLREAEERAIARFGLPSEVCARFRRVYSPWRRVRVGALLLGSVTLASVCLTSRQMPLAASLIPVLMGLVPAYRRRSARAGILPGVAACGVSFLVWLWCELVVPGWYRGPSRLPPLSAIGAEVIFDLAFMALLLLQVTAGAALGAYLGGHLERRFA